PALMHKYRSRYPAVTVSLDIGNSEQVCSLVREGAADLGLIEAAIDDPALIASPVAKDEMILVAAPDHPWAAGCPKLAADFAAGPWVMREQGSGTRSIFEAALPDRGLKPADLNVVLELPSNEAVRAAVEAGAGGTVLSKHVCVHSLRGGRRRHGHIKARGLQLVAGRDPCLDRHIVAAAQFFRPAAQGALRRQSG